MEMIKYLSIILSEIVNLSPSACGGLIRLAIKDEIGPYKPIKQLDLNDYRNSCENALNHRLQKLGITNAKHIIKCIIKELIQNQSLITMEKV